MKLYLANNKKIYSYQLSNIKDEYIIHYHSTYKDEIKKIIIKEHENELYLISTLNISIYEDGKPLEYIKLTGDSHFYIRINDIEEDILVITKRDNMQYFDFKNINNILTIGNNLEDIEYVGIPLETISIKKEEGIWHITNTNKYVYLNDKYVTNSVIRTGDKITIYNLSIIFMNNFIRVSKINNTNIRLKRVVNEYEDNYELSKEEYPNNYNDNIIIENEKINPLKPVTIDLDVDYIPVDEKTTIYYQASIIIVLILLIISIATTLVSISSIIGNNTTISDEKINFLGALLLLIVAGIIYIYTRKSANKKYLFNYAEYFKKISKEISERKAIEKDYLNKLYPPLTYVVTHINRNINIYYKKVDDFEIRVATGKRKADIKLDTGKLLYNRDRNIVKDQIAELENKLYIDNAPITYNFKYGKELGIKINTIHKKEYLDALLLPIISSYNPEDLKIVLILSEDNISYYKEYLHIPHIMADNIRFFATNQDELNTVENYLKNNKNNYLIINDSNLNINNTKYYCINFNTDNNLLEVLDDKIIYQEKEYKTDYIEINTHYLITKLIAINPKPIQNLLDYRLTFLDLYKVGNIKDLDIEKRWNTKKKEIIIGTNNDKEFNISLDNTTVIGSKEERNNYILTYLLSLSINYNLEDLGIIIVNSTNLDVKTPHLITNINLNTNNDYYRFTKIIEPLLTTNKNILIVVDDDNIYNNNFFLTELDNKLKKHKNLKLLIATTKLNDKLNNYTKVLFNNKDIPNNIESLNKNEVYYYKDEPIKLTLPDINELYTPKNEYTKNSDNKAIFINNIGHNYKYIDLEEKKHSIKYFIEKEEDNIRDTYNNYDYPPILPNTIYLADLLKEFPLSKNKYSYETILGVYENLDKIEQTPLVLNLLLSGNIIIYGNDSKETSSLIKTMLLSLCYYHHPEELDINIIDNEANLSALSFLPNVGSYIKKDQERTTKLLDYLKEEYENRKRLLIRYENDLTIYNKRTKEKLPLLVTVINSFQLLKNSTISKYQDMLKNSHKYGMVIIATSIEELSSRLFDTKIALKIKDSFDYRYLLNAPAGLVPSDSKGRGLISFSKEIYEFQSAILNEEELIDSSIHTAGTKLYKFYKAKNRKKDV